MKITWPWSKSVELKEGETITLQLRQSHLEPTWWHLHEPGENAYEKGYDAGFLDGIQLRYRAERSGKIPKAG